MLGFTGDVTVKILSETQQIGAQKAIYPVQPNYVISKRLYAIALTR
jgi:hypothetical protein